MKNATKTKTTHATTKKKPNASSAHAAAPKLDVATDAKALFESIDGIIEEAREQMIRAAGLFAIVQGAPEGCTTEDAAPAFNQAMGEADSALSALRGELAAALDGSHHFLTKNGARRRLVIVSDRT